MGPKTDKIVRANLSKLEEYLDAGLLKDINDEVCDDDAIVMIFMRVSRVKDPDDLPQIAGFVDGNGNMINVAPSTPASTEEAEDDIPF
jgi:hypothetical protein